MVLGDKSDPKRANQVARHTKGFYGNQSVAAFRLAELGALGSVAFFAMGSIYDNIRIASGELPAIEGVGNLSAGILGLAGGPVGLTTAGGYFGLQYFYPGGASGALIDSVTSQHYSPDFIPLP